MRVVVDTNVFVSAALSGRSSPALTVYLVERRCTLLKSTATEQELLQVVGHSGLASLVAPTFLEWLSKLLASAEWVPIKNRVTECRDPKDDKFLELALNGHADVIVSGDQDLLTLHPFRGIPVLKPADFIQMITG
jgi:putative PIN family toxin of toxin-antitoxin system